ncbi:acyltransferase domain-containing protein, partial [Actinomadura roseirufa]|uniref:acyltransferase domain-containing protein n=1 Tax=Actinomadura roseirufa TaxID=2094049 RepID=UPI001A955C69
MVGPAVAGAEPAAPVLVFPGQGSQWAGMGAELLESSPVFAARIAECEQALAPYVDWSLTGVLRGDGSELARVDVVQPVLWATMVSLAAVWASHGVVPAAVVGHSQGEIAAACVAGALSLGDGAKVVALRSRALRGLAGGGAMASLGVGEEQAEALLSGDVTVAAINGPSSTVVSGTPEHVAAVVARAEAQGLRARTIDVDYASHGPQVDRIAPEIAARLAGVTWAATETAFYSTVTGEKTDTGGLDAGYWVTNLRRPVRFAAAVDALLDAGHRLFIEVSPHPVLAVGMQETFERAGAAATAVPTLRRDQGGRDRLARALGHAFTAGAAIDWAGWFGAADPAGTGPRTVDLPTYAFQRRRYWAEDGAAPGGDPAGLGLTAAGHPLLGAAVEIAEGGTRLLTGRVPASGGAGWLADHRVGGTVLVPGAALVEWALRAADDAGRAGVAELTLREPLVLPAAGGARVQVVVGPPGDDGGRDVHVYSRPDRDDEAPWACHASGVLAPEGDAGPPPENLGGAWPPAGALPLDVSGLYERAADAGYGYGPAFQGLRAAWRDGDDVLAEVTLPEEAGRPGGFGVHPALLDAALHATLLAGRPDDTAGDGQVWLPFSWSGVTLWAGDATSVRVRLSPLPGEGRGMRVVVADTAGAPVLSADAVTLRPADTARLRAAGRHGADGLYTLDWTPLPDSTVSDSVASDSVASDSGVPGGEGWAVLGPDLAAPGLPVHDDLGALVAEIDAGAAVPPVVLTRVASAGQEGPGAVLDALTRIQAWLAEPRFEDARLVLVTSGAVADGDPDPSAAAVWGLVRGAQAEHPDRFVLLDADPAAAPPGGLVA